jgi:hypothetical protein
MRTLITDGTIVTASGSYEADVLVDGGQSGRDRDHRENDDGQHREADDATTEPGATRALAIHVPEGIVAAGREGQSGHGRSSGGGVGIGGGRVDRPLSRL